MKFEMNHSRGNLYWIIVLGLTIFSTGCASRMMYKQDTRPYDYKEAFSQAELLQKGTLLVSIPTYSRKIDLLDKVVKNDSNNEKSLTKLEKERAYAKKTRLEFIKYFKELYDFSNYIIVEDSLIRNLIKGELITLNPDLILGSQKTIQISADSTYFLCKQGRFTDDLFISKIDGTQVPSPFPMDSTIGTMEMDSENADRLSEVAEESSIGHAVLCINAKLKRFIARK